MSYQSVKDYFERNSIADHITEHEQTSDTVEHAAQTIGCTPAEIAKALSFLLDGKPMMIVKELEQHSNSAGWADVCKGWFVNEAVRTA